MLVFYHCDVNPKPPTLLFNIRIQPLTELLTCLKVIFFLNEKKFGCAISRWCVLSFWNNLQFLTRSAALFRQKRLNVIVVRCVSRNLDCERPDWGEREKKRNLKKGNAAYKIHTHYAHRLDQLFFFLKSWFHILEKKKSYLFSWKLCRRSYLCL